MGARPLRRTIEQYLEDPLAEKLLLHPDLGRRCLATIKEDSLVLIDKETFPLQSSPESLPNSGEATLNNASQEVKEEESKENKEKPKRKKTPPEK